MSDVFDTKARVPVDDESNRLLQEEPFGVYTGLGMVALTEQLLLPRLQHIENVFMTSRNIPIRHAIKVADDNPNERIYFTDICIKHDDNSDAAAFLRRQQRGSFVTVRYRSTGGQWRTEEIVVDEVNSDDWWEVIALTIKGRYDFGLRSVVQFAESTGLRRLTGTLRRLRFMLDRILNPGTRRPVTLMTEWYERHLRDLTAIRRGREANEDRKAVKTAQIEAFVKRLHDSDGLAQNLKQDLSQLTKEQVMAIRQMVVENHFVLDGAFGTGKTLLIALAAVFVAYEQKKKVLLLAKTNEAADHLALKVYELAEPFLQKKLEELNLKAWANSGNAGIPIVRHYAYSIKKDWLTSEDGTKIVDCGMYSQAKNDLVNKKIVITTAENATSHTHFVNKEAARVLAESELDLALVEHRTPFEADVIIVDEAGLLHYIHMLLLMLCVARQVTLDEHGEHKPTKISIVGDIRQLIPNLSVHWPLHEEELNNRGFNLCP
ncbi:hypothetical protein AAVH_14455 [Aphelenchoides avenae]|nr:hypothetical protein AAVH_14455 [Aphelenchus avenae]